MSIHSLKSL